MQRYHVTLWGHPRKPARTFFTDWLWSACEDYPCISVMRTETIPIEAVERVLDAAGAKEKLRETKEF